VPAEPIDDDNPIEAILLTGFPNPERIGCLAPDVIEALGQKQLPREDPAWRHIWNCSPCFRAFKIIRDRRLAAVERAEKRRKQFGWIAAIAAGLAIISFLYFVGIPKLRSPVEATVIPIDLTNAGIVRGSSNPENGPTLAELPTTNVRLKIFLPRASKGGRYMVAILKSRTEDAAVALGSALAAPGAENQGLLVTLPLDLSTAEAGRYYLATRLLEAGQDASYYYPVLIVAK
jgi:hypothetical protein